MLPADLKSISLSPAQARKIVLHSQWMYRNPAFNEGEEAVLAIIRHLGYVQIDSISVVERAHHHLLWSRLPGYDPVFLNRLQEKKQIFEYWAHAAAFLPYSRFRFCLPRMAERERGAGLWFKQDPKTTRYVLDRITGEGPLKAKDFKGSNPGPWWGWKPAKIALEHLFQSGRLMVVRREGFQKVYDLRERVLPAGIDTRTPSRKEYIHHLIKTFLNAHGLGQAKEMGYLLAGVLPDIRTCLNEMAENGDLIRVSIKKDIYFCFPQALELLDRPLPRNPLLILSPFDNLIIQRDRLKNLFGFDYRIESYLPPGKRKYGYFVLPLFKNGKFVGRMDAKARRKEKMLYIHHLALESGIRDPQPLFRSLSSALVAFARFNGCDQIGLNRVSPDRWMAAARTMEDVNRGRS